MALGRSRKHSNAQVRHTNAFSIKKIFFFSRSCTGRLVSIVVTPSWRACAAEALILNWVTAPDVFIWSAVAASCALPGLLPPCELFAKGVNGEPTSYCPIGKMEAFLVQRLVGRY